MRDSRAPRRAAHDSPVMRARSARGDRVAVAVSGGADSVALVLAAARARRRDRRIRARRAHPRQSRAARRGVGRATKRSAARSPLAWRCRSTSGASTSRARARDARQSLEAAARDVRYRVLRAGGRAARRDARRDRPHARRSGRDRAAAAAARRGESRRSAAFASGAARIIRPLLDCRRAELRALPRRARRAVLRGRVESSIVGSRAIASATSCCRVIERSAPGGVAGPGARSPRWRGRR